MLNPLNQSCTASFGAYARSIKKAAGSKSPVSIVRDIRTPGASERESRGSEGHFIAIIKQRRLVRQACASFLRDYCAVKERVRQARESSSAASWWTFLSSRPYRLPERLRTIASSLSDFLENG